MSFTPEFANRYNLCKELADTIDRMIVNRSADSFYLDGLKQTLRTQSVLLAIESGHMLEEVQQVEQRKVMKEVSE